MDKKELDQKCIDIQNVSKSIDFSSLNFLGDHYKELIIEKFKQVSILSNFPSSSADVATPSQHVGTRMDMPIKDFDRVTASVLYDILETDIVYRSCDLFTDSLKKAKVEKFDKLSMDIFDSPKDAGLFYLDTSFDINRELRNMPLEVVEHRDFCNTGRFAKTKIGSTILINTKHRLKDSYKENTVYFVPFDAVKIVENDFTVMSCIKNRNGELFVGWEIMKELNLNIDVDRAICFEKVD